MEIIKHKGTVIEVFTKEHRLTSGAYSLATFALVWDNGQPKEILVNISVAALVKPDATETVKGLYAVWMVNAVRGLRAYRQASTRG